MARSQKTAVFFVTIMSAMSVYAYADAQTADPDDKAAASSTQAPAPQADSTLTCSGETNDLSDLPANTSTVTVTVTEPYILGLCKDAEGQKISVVTPALPYTFNIDAGKTVVVAYTVKDTSGATASGSITYTRP